MNESTEPGRMLNWLNAMEGLSDCWTLQQKLQEAMAKILARKSEAMPHAEGLDMFVAVRYQLSCLHAAYMLRTSGASKAHHLRPVFSLKDTCVQGFFHRTLHSHQVQR